MRKILQYKDHKKVGCYSTQGEASRITGLPQSNICDCLNGHRRTCGGFTWGYIYDHGIDLTRVEDLISEGYLINEALFHLGIDINYYRRHVSPEKRKKLLLMRTPAATCRIYSKPHSYTRRHWGGASLQNDKFIYNAY